MSTLSYAHKKPKIAHIITRLILGGAQENTLLSVEGLMKRGYEVWLVTGPALGKEGSLIPRAQAHGVKIKLIYELRRQINPFLDLVAAVKLWVFLRRERFAIVHTHSAKAGILGRAVAWLSGTRLIVHTIHAFPFHGYQSPFLNGLYKFLEKIAARLSTCSIAVSDSLAKDAVRLGIAPASKVVTIYSGMELERFLSLPDKAGGLKESLGIPAQSPVVGKIARLYHLKGHEDFLEAASLVARGRPQTRFLLVGDGILRESLKRRAEELGIGDKVIFLGLVPPEEIPSLIASMDILVHASLREGLARVLVQAGACARPAVAFRLDSAWEVVKDGVTGFLVPAKDTQALAQKILWLLDNKEEAQRMGRKAREMVQGQFSHEVMVDRIDGLYRRLLAEI